VSSRLVVLGNVADIFSLVEFPRDIVFWRSAEETIVHHRNPLWDVGLGLTACKSLTVDVLHCLHLGVFAQWCKFAVWLLLESPLWAPRDVAADERVRISVLCMRNEMDAFFKNRRLQHPNENLTQPHDLTDKMFGTRSSPSLKLSGAETWAFLLYMVWALNIHAGQLPAVSGRVHQAGVCLERLYTVMQHNQANFMPAQIQDVL
jgi:hypothetical protein